MDGRIAKNIAAEMEAKLTEAMFGGPPPKPRQTALRMCGNGFEAVELDDNGNVIEPVRCTCGAWSVFHRSGCAFAYTCS